MLQLKIKRVVLTAGHFLLAGALVGLDARSREVMAMSSVLSMLGQWFLSGSGRRKRIRTLAFTAL
jgi:hypothetical protein